jgi:hypothetical protein
MNSTLYRYISKVPYVIQTTNYTLQPFQEIKSAEPIPELDRLDGISIEKLLNGKERIVEVEYNSYNPAISSSKGDGIKLNIDNPRFGWHDMLSGITVDQGSQTHKPTFSLFIGGIKKYRFAIGDESFHQYHIPHDYAPNTDIYIHTHWAVITPPTAGSTVTWQFEATTAKGYSQAAFPTTVTTTVTQGASSTPYTHHIAETILSGPGLINKSDIETDGIILVKTKLLNHNLGIDPFMLFCDIHYQSTGMPTANKNYNFWI